MRVHDDTQKSTMYVTCLVLFAHNDIPLNVERHQDQVSKVWFLNSDIYVSDEPIQ